MVCENGLSTQVIIELAKKEEVDTILDSTGQSICVKSS